MCGEFAAVCVYEQITRKGSGDKGFKNVPTPARQTPPINPENYTFRFPLHKKWVIQNSCPKVGRSFFGKKGQHFLDSIRSGLCGLCPAHLCLRFVFSLFRFVFSTPPRGTENLHKYSSVFCILLLA